MHFILKTSVLGNKYLSLFYDPRKLISISPFSPLERPQKFWYKVNLGISQIHTQK